jgi:D-alanyl-D-alanine carboxypeptidase (penicillin-binding protein 5/6)
MPPERRLVPIWLRVVIPVLLLAGLVTYQLLRPIPAIAVSGTSVPASTTMPGTAPVIPWPASGSAALSVTDLGMLGTAGGDKPAPIASMAKVMTALVVMKDRPLKKDEQGPAITITAADVADYNKRKQDESVVPVTAGEQLSEYQALQALLIPSANNVAQTLAIWDAGSVDAFLAKMKAMGTDLGLKQSAFADVAGVSSSTVSTPSDLIVMGKAAMADPVIASIVAQPEAQLPVAGRVFNVDNQIGQEGIVGIKTGSSPEAGSCFVFAATASVSGRPVTIYGAIMGQSDLAHAFATTKTLIQAARAGLSVRRVVTKNQAVARYGAPWGAATDAIATQDVDVLAWPGMIMRTRVENPVLRAPQPAGVAAGTMVLTLGDQRLTVPLTTADKLPEPGRRWRLTRIS